MFYAQQAPGPAEASGEQDVTAEFGQDGAGGAWQTSHHGGFAAFPHGAGLKPGGERIAKTTHQKQLRGASDHGGAHQDEERRAIVEAKAPTSSLVPYSTVRAPTTDAAPLPFARFTNRVTFSRLHSPPKTNTRGSIPSVGSTLF